MKTHHFLDCSQQYEFIVLAINCHSKAYKLCWNLNQALLLNLEMVDDHKINDELIFSRYLSKNYDGGTFNLLSNRSKKGYMIPSQKSINYFLIISKDFWSTVKYEFLSKLREINDILLVFEISMDKEKNSDRFIIHDTKN